jgi:hypothetical protein
MPMKRAFVALVAAAVTLAVPAGAEAKRFFYFGGFRDEPQSTVQFAVKANKKGTQVHAVRHLGLWDWPRVCGAATELSTINLAGPIDVTDNELNTGPTVIGDVTLTLTAEFKDKGKKVTGTWNYEEADPDCATDGALEWRAKRA